MEKIISLANERIKAVCRLKTSKGRKEEGKFFAEGIKIIRDNRDGIVQLFIREDKVAEFSGEFRDVKEIYEVSEQVFSKMSDTETPQGILAVYKIPEKKSAFCGRRGIVLDGVGDPGNVGTILRTAVAAGYDFAVTINSADVYSPKVVRSSMGGVFRLDIHEKTCGDFLREAKDQGYSVLALDMGGKNVFDYATPQKFCVVVGNEGSGICAEMRNNANEILAIPMSGNIESLNAGVSAGIAMYVLK